MDPSQGGLHTYCTLARLLRKPVCKYAELCVSALDRYSAQ
jgi:hypothetical protein